MKRSGLSSLSSRMSTPALPPEQVLQMVRSAETSSGGYPLVMLLWMGDAEQLPAEIRQAVAGDLERLWAAAAPEMWAEITTMGAWLGGAEGLSFYPKALAKLHLLLNATSEETVARGLRTHLAPALARALADFPGADPTPLCDLLVDLWSGQAREGNASEPWVQGLWEVLLRRLEEEDAPAGARTRLLEAMARTPGDAVRVPDLFRLSEHPWAYQSEAFARTVREGIEVGVLPLGSALPHLPLSELTSLLEGWMEKADRHARDLVSLLRHLAEQRPLALSRDVLLRLLGSPSAEVRLEAIRLAGHLLPPGELVSFFPAAAQEKARGSGGARR